MILCEARSDQKSEMDYQKSEISPGLAYKQGNATEVRELTTDRHR